MKQENDKSGRTGTDVAVKPRSIDFARISLDKLNSVIATGTLDALSPEEREYYYLMDLVRGLNMRAKFEDRTAITKAGIIKLLKKQYHVSDWMARRIYSDSLNFFYQQTDATTEAFSNLYADLSEQWARQMAAAGDFKEARSLLKQAGEFRGCFKPREAEIPEELLDQKRITIYSANREDVGVPAIDRRELEAFIDSIPELNTQTRDRLKEDAGIRKFDLTNRMIYDAEILDEETE